MNEITTEKTMTTKELKELAETLGVDVRTVQLTVQHFSLAKVLSQVKIRGQNSFIFNEKQATLIKQEIAKHHNLASRQIDSVTTPIQIFEKDGLQLISARELHQKLEFAERFSKWWERFVSYGFEENIDFTRGCTKKIRPL